MCCDCCGGEHGRDECDRHRLRPDGGERDEGDEEVLDPADIVDDVLDGDESSGDTEETHANETEEDGSTDPLASGSDRTSGAGGSGGFDGVDTDDRDELGGTVDSGETASETDQDSDTLTDTDRRGETSARQDGDREEQSTSDGKSGGQADAGRSPPPDERGGGSERSREENREKLGGRESGIVAQLEALPLRWGGGLGGLIAGVPYVLLSLVVAVIHERNAVVAGNEVSALDVGAEVFLSVLAFGSPERIRDALVGVADIDLDAVDPADYPTTQDQIGPTLQFVQDAPAALLLGLYLLVPYLLLRAGVWLATEHAPGERARDYLAAGLTVTLGVLPVVVLVALIFTVVDIVGKVLVGGVLIPVIFGGIGGLSAWAYDESLRMSGAFGVGAVVVGLVAAFGLVGWVVDGTITLSERLVAGLLAYLEVMQFSVESSTAAWVLFGVAVLALLAAGVVRAWSVRDSLSEPAAGARVGASIAYGVVWTVGILLWAVPFALILTGNPDSSGVSATLGEYRNAIVFAGLVVPAIAGAVGGVLALLYRYRTASSGREQSNL